MKTALPPPGKPARSGRTRREGGEYTVRSRGPQKRPEPIILASASPRRRDLLREAGWRLRVIPSSVPERRRRGETPAGFAVRLAREKAAAVASGLPRGLVIGADTIVVLDGRVLGKPRSAAAARALLRALSGRTHRVITAVTVLDAASGRCASGMDVTRVRFRPILEHEIRAYVAGGEPMDKAGAYAIQGGAADFVRSISGSLTNVIGLPMELLRDLLGPPPRG